MAALVPTTPVSQKMGKKKKRRQALFFEGLFSEASQVTLHIPHWPELSHMIDQAMLS